MYWPNSSANFSVRKSLPIGEIVRMAENGVHPVVGRREYCMSMSGENFLSVKVRRHAGRG